MSTGWLALVLGAFAFAGCNGDRAPRTAAGPTSIAPAGSSGPSGSAAPSDPAAPSGSAAPSSPATPSGSDGPSAPTGPSSDPPEGQRCLPVNVCDQWSGCGLVAPATKFWKVIAADRFAPGDIVDVTSVCTSGDTCVAIRGIPKGIQCPAWTTPVYIKPPEYRCAWDGKTCHRT